MEEIVKTAELSHENLIFKLQVDLYNSQLAAEKAIESREHYFRQLQISNSIVINLKNVIEDFKIELAISKAEIRLLKLRLRQKAKSHE